MSVTHIEGDLVHCRGRYVIVCSRFNEFIVNSLVDGAIGALRAHGIDDGSIRLVKVPGAFEIPVAVKRVVDRGDCDAVIAVGAVIRGGTPHFDYVAGECVKGLGQIAISSGTPVTFGLLTVDSIEQAIERAGTKAGNKGAEAAITALEMVSLLERLGS